MKRPDLSERDRAAFGPRSLKPVGSPEWCWQTLSGLIADYKLIDERFDQVGTALDELTKAEAWEVIPSGKPYGTRNRMLAAELGVDTRTVQQEIRQARKRKLQGYGGARAGAGRPKRGEGRDTINQGSNTILKSQERGRAYILDRLDRADKKDLARRGLSQAQFSDLATKVRANEMPALAAAIEAGWRKPSSALDRIVKLLPKLTDDEREELRQMLE